MPTTSIFCPNCNNKLRVPEELMAQPVECPKCGTTFTAPPPVSGSPPNEHERFRERQPAPVAPAPIEQDEDYRRRGYDDWEDEEYRPVNTTKITIPAIFLLLMSGGVLIDAGYRLITALFFPKMMEEALANMQKIMPGMPGGNMDTARATSAIIGGIFLPIALLMFAGAIAMMRRRMYGLAMAGSIASMLTLNCCCVPGLAVGLWCIIILMQPDVKSSFS
ncbi:MAG TPA: hypothetical protein VKS79_09805 [Gemmataceae bacterium]|nr:hypothetical protein [Gemmataceae bacterium]